MDAYHNDHALNDAGIHIGDFFIYDSLLWVKTQHNAAMNPQFGTCSFHDVRPTQLTKLDWKDVEQAVFRAFNAKEIKTT
jgi:hypothetical protein